MSVYKNLVGKKIGKWTVIAETDQRNPTKFLCECECGNKVEVRSGSLMNGSSSCCVKCRSKTHGGSDTRLYKVWQDMKTRCYNPNNKHYKDYGGRGIIICDDWKDNYPKFKEWAGLNGYGSALTIDRIDVDGDYEPDNCRWATIQQQNNNTRRTKVTINGITMSGKQWCESLGVNYYTYRARVHKLHESVERALRLDAE